MPIPGGTTCPIRIPNRVAAATPGSCPGIGCGIGGSNAKFTVSHPRDASSVNPPAIVKVTPAASVRAETSIGFPDTWPNVSPHWGQTCRPASIVPKLSLSCPQSGQRDSGDTTTPAREGRVVRPTTHSHVIPTIGAGG